MYYLRQICRAHGRTELYVSFIRRFLLHYHFYKRTLAGSVIADERYVLAARNVQLKSVKQLSLTECLGYVMAHEHLITVEIR